MLSPPFCISLIITEREEIWEKKSLPEIQNLYMFYYLKMMQGIKSIGEKNCANWIFTEMVKEQELVAPTNE
jgi:hypothetical protein